VATCASIKASQSTLVVVFVPDVVVAKAAVAAAEVELVTVAMPPYFPARGCEPALPPARDCCGLAEQLQQILRHLVRRRFCGDRSLHLDLRRRQLGLLGCDVDIGDRRIGGLQILGLRRDRAGAEIEARFLRTDRRASGRDRIDGSVERVDGAVAPACVLTSSVSTPNVVEVRSSSFTVIVSADVEPTRTEAPAANALVPSSRLCPL
jgi:hypothetical protein